MMLLSINCHFEGFIAKVSYTAILRAIGRKISGWQGLSHGR